MLLTAAAVAFGWVVEAQDYSKSFQEGMKALDRKRWEEVARHMQDAIDQNSREGESLRLYGVRFEVYVPHYYLGMAKYYLGDCQGAIKAWKASEDQGAVSEKQLREVESMRQECQPQVLPVEPPPPPPKSVAPSPTPPPPQIDQEPLEEALARAREALSLALRAQRQVEALETDSSFDEVFAEAPELKTEKASAKGELEKVQDRLASSNLEDLEAARRSASQAEQKFQDIVRRASGLREKLQRQALAAEDSRRQQAYTDFGLRLAAARRLIDQAPVDLAGNARERRIVLERLIADLGSLGSDADRRQLEDGWVRLDRGVKELEKALANRAVTPPAPAPSVIEPDEEKIKAAPSSAPPARLRSAAEAFFEARYDQTLELLEEVGFIDDKARATGHLLSGAARYLLFLESERRDEALRDAALADVLRCRELDSEVKPHPEMFSPAFREFFESAR